MELNITHSRYIRIQHMQSNDIELRWHVCKRLKRLVKLLVILWWQIHIKKNIFFSLCWNLFTRSLTSFTHFICTCKWHGDTFVPVRNIWATQNAWNILDCHHFNTEDWEPTWLKLSKSLITSIKYYMSTFFL